MTTRYVPETATAQQRLDDLAIRSLTERYTDAVNQRDWPILRDCWTVDATWELAAPVNLIMIYSEQQGDAMQGDHRDAMRALLVVGNAAARR